MIEGELAVSSKGVESNCDVGLKELNVLQQVMGDPVPVSCRPCLFSWLENETGPLDAQRHSGEKFSLSH